MCSLLMCHMFLCGSLGSNTTESGTMQVNDNLSGFFLLNFSIPAACLSADRAGRFSVFSSGRFSMASTNLNLNLISRFATTSLRSQVVMMAVVTFCDQLVLQK